MIPEQPAFTETELAAAARVVAGWPIGPRPYVCTCGEPWHAHQDGYRRPPDVLAPPYCPGFTHEAGDALAVAACDARTASLVDDMTAYDDAQYQARRRARPPGPRVSDVGSCRRQVWYREVPPPGYVPGRVDRRAATIGSAIHDKAATARAWAYPWRKVNMAVHVPGLDGTYYIDEYDPILGLVVDDKTAGERKWQIMGDDGPSPEQWDQVMIYGLGLDAAGWPVNEVQIIGVRRDDGTEETYTRRYDPAVALAALDTLTELADMLELGITPPRDGHGLSDWRCVYCPALAHCWQVDDARRAGRSPESWVGLGAEPADETILWAAAHVHELQKAASAAKAAHDQAKKLLEGIPSGTYGEFVVKNATRKMPAYKDTHARNLGYWLLDPDQRPAFEVVAEPERRVDRYVTVSRVRAAKREQRRETPVDDTLDTIA